MKDHEIIPEIITAFIWAYFVFVCIVTGVRGLRGKPISLPSRGGGVGQPIRGQSARVAGAIFLILGLTALIFPFAYALNRHRW